MTMNGCLREEKNLRPTEQAAVDARERGDGLTTPNCTELNMATIIEAQLLELIEQVNSVTWNLQGLGKIGTCMTSNFEVDAFVNLIEFMTELQSDRVDDLTSYLEKNLLKAKEPG